MMPETQLFHDYIAVATKLLHKMGEDFLGKLSEKILFYFSKGIKCKVSKEDVVLHIGLMVVYKFCMKVHTLYD
jgi:hypothetical protein